MRRAGVAQSLVMMMAGAAAQCLSGVALAQTADLQRSDPAFEITVGDPLHASGRGPRVCFDHGHHNFHRLDGRFAAFGALLRADGYQLTTIAARFTQRTLKPCRLLVIANAQPADVPWEEYIYPTPSAFSQSEIRAVERWVQRGGRLLLLADHMPLAGAASALAAAFDIDFNDGFAVEDFRGQQEGRAAFLKPTRFDVSDGTLRQHAVTAGRRPGDAVTHVYSFIGQAFRVGPQASPLLVLPGNFVSLMPRIAWQFDANTPKLPVGGWLQGATLEPGRGRVAVFGEAALFSAQISADGRTIGMNAPQADQNARFVRNLVDWLTGN